MSDVFWAAFGGGAAAGMVTLVSVMTAEWFRWFLDRPLVKVDISLGFFINAGSRDQTRQVFFTARNPHTKPVTLETFGLSYRQKEWGKLQVLPQAGYQFPYQLDGSKSVDQ